MMVQLVLQSSPGPVLGAALASPAGLVARKIGGGGICDINGENARKMGGTWGVSAM